MATIRRKGPNECLRCGAQDAQVRTYADTVDFRGLTFDVDHLVESRCGACGLQWTTEGQDHDNLARIRAAFAGVRDEVRTQDGLLTGDQIAFVLDQLGLSKADAAATFGGGPNAFAKYISGEVLQSVAMDRLLRMTLAIGVQGVRFAQRGGAAPLALNGLGYFVAAPGHLDLAAAPLKRRASEASAKKAGKANPLKSRKAPSVRASRSTT